MTFLLESGANTGKKDSGTNPRKAQIFKVLSGGGIIDNLSGSDVTFSYHGYFNSLPGWYLVDSNTTGADFDVYTFGYNKKLSYTDKSEVIFKTLYHTDTDVTVYIFSETDKEDTAIRKSISAKQLAEMVNSGMELEFLYSYKGYQSYIFECWLWSDTEPFHKECVIIISADDVLYNWNVLYAEE